jgi:hypothetical protein
VSSGAVCGAALAGAAAAAAIWGIAFHGEIGQFLATLRWEQHHGSLHSIPKTLCGFAGVPLDTWWLRLACQVVLAAALALTLRYAYRGGDWLRAAGWGTCALLVTTAWLLPWYVIWLLPIAAFTGDRKLRLATILLSAFLIGMRMPYYFGWN